MVYECAMGDFTISSIKSSLGWVRGNVIRLLRKLRDRPIYTVCIFMAIYASYFSYYTIINHYTFRTYAYDLGNYMQCLWTTLHGGGILYSPLAGTTFFAWHFRPILLLLLPSYALFPRAETLLVLQSLVLALGALPIYWMAKDELGGKYGVLFAGLYLLYPALHGVNSSDFHPVALAITPLLFSFYMFKKRRYGWGMAFALLAMMCQEDVPLVVIFMGLYWLWKERETVIDRLKRRSLPREREILFPACLVFVGITWLSMVYFVVYPHFGYFAWKGFWPHYYAGGNPFQIQNLFTDAGPKALFLLYLFAPLAFTSLLNLPILLIGLPIFAESLLATNEAMYVISNQHVSLLIPWIFIASIYGVRWLVSSAGHRRYIGGIVFYTLLPVGLIAALLLSPSPIALRYGMPQLTAHHHVLEQAITLVPGEASIYTQNDIFPHVCNRMHAYCTPWDPDIFRHDFDYILVDTTTRWSVLDIADEESLQRMEEEYGVFAQGDGVYLYLKGYEGDAITLGEYGY